MTVSSFNEPKRHYLSPRERLVAIQMESPLLKNTMKQSGADDTIGRLIDRYDFNFLVQMAEKGIEAEERGKRK